MAHPALQIFQDEPALVRAAATSIANRAVQCIQSSGRFTLVLGCDPTLLRVCAELANPQNAARIDWAKTEIYFAHECSVPPAVAESCFHRIRLALFDHLPGRPPTIHRIKGEIDPESAAIEYGRLLKSRFGDGGADLILLELGAGGRISALYPRSDAILEPRHRCLAHRDAPSVGFGITLTPAFINRAQAVFVLASGNALARDVAAVLEGNPDPLHFPGQSISPTGELVWLLDSGAAGMNDER